MTQLLSYLIEAIEEQVTVCGRPIFGAKLEAWRHNILHILHSLQSHMVSEIKNPFSGILNSVSSKNGCPISINMYLTSGQCSLSRLRNPDWSIQISSAPAVCKAGGGGKT